MSGGAAIRFTSQLEDDRLVYSVHNVAGVFVVEPEPYAVPWAGRVFVGYGRDFWHQPQPLPDAPVIYGITLVGGSCFDPTDMDLDNPWHWLQVRRSTGRRTSQAVPDGTRARVARIVHALVTDWLERADLAALGEAANRRHAPAQHQARARELDRLEKQRADLDTQIGAALGALAQLQPFLTAIVA